jgi:EAL domain-containing protein (putative c-di-GMP-specific phosphodiesterase class I)
VIAQGIAFAAQANQDGFDLVVSVNVSIRDLLDTELADYVALLLTEASVAPEMLILEVTEREIMDERSSFQEATRVLSETGVGLAIDDLGTGHSSLVRLHQLPATELKIDRRFIADLERDSEATPRQTGK